MIADAVIPAEQSSRRQVSTINGALRIEDWLNSLSILGVWFASAALAVSAAAKENHPLKIHVAAGDWGGSDREEIERGLDSAANQSWINVTDRQLNTILVEDTDDATITLYLRGPHLE